jgi:hypothetical protein
MLGENAMILDEERTRTSLMDTAGEGNERLVESFMDRLDRSGDLEGDSDVLDEVLEEPADGYIFMQYTGFAQLLIEGVLPTLLERICPPPVVTNQTNLKLC